MKKSVLAAVAMMACLATGSMASAAWNVDDDGIGFVGKGDVQIAFGWNNQALQFSAEYVQFQISSETVSEVSWICTKDNENTQERARTTTETKQGVLDSIARLKNQITGFNLTGFDGDPTSSSETDGPELNTCPSKWELTTPAGDPEVISSTGGLQVSNDGYNWIDLD